MKKPNLPIVVNSYFWLTIIGWILLVTSISHFSVNWASYTIYLVGCHTTLYSFLSAIIAAETEIAWLVYAVFAIGVLYWIAFVGSYLWAVWAKGYLPMAIVALIDTAFSAFMVMNAIINVGFMRDHLMIIIGVLLSLAVSVILFRGVADSPKSKDEMLRG